MQNSENLLNLFKEFDSKILASDRFLEVHLHTTLKPFLLEKSLGTQNDSLDVLGNIYKEMGEARLLEILKAFVCN